MRIFCLGVGLVGSYVAKKLAQAGHEVHAFDPDPHRVSSFPGIMIHNLGQDIVLQLYLNGLSIKITF